MVKGLSNYIILILRWCLKMSEPPAHPKFSSLIFSDAVPWRGSADQRQVLNGVMKVMYYIYVYIQDLRHQGRDNFNQLLIQWASVNELSLSCNNREECLWTWLPFITPRSFPLSKAGLRFGGSNQRKVFIILTLIFSIEPAKNISWSSVLHHIACLVSQRKVIILTLVSWGWMTHRLLLRLQQSRPPPAS